MPMRADQSEEPLLSSSAPPGEMWVMETGPGKHPRGDTPLPRTVSRHGSRGTVFPKGTDWRISFVRWYCCALQCLIRCPCLTSCTYSHSAHDFVLDLCVCVWGGAIWVFWFICGLLMLHYQIARQKVPTDVIMAWMSGWQSAASWLDLTPAPQERMHAWYCKVFQKSITIGFQFRKLENQSLIFCFLASCGSPCESLSTGKRSFSKDGWEIH